MEVPIYSQISIFCLAVTYAILAGKGKRREENKMVLFTISLLNIMLCYSRLCYMKLMRARNRAVQYSLKQINLKIPKVKEV